MQVNRVSFDGMKKNGRLGTKKAQAQTFGSASTIISKAGDAVDKFSKSSSGKKFLDVIQFDSLNMSFPILFTTTYGFVLLPRIIQAQKRGKAKTQGAKNVELKDILRRDIPSIGAVLFSVPLLNKTMAKVCQEKSGLILSTNPNRKTQGFWKNVFDTIRPEKGDRVLNAFDAKHLYSGIDDYLSAGKPATDFFKVLTDNGANLGKMFKNLKEDAPVLENMYKEAGKTGSIFASSNDDILEVVGRAFKEDAPEAMKKGAESLKKVFSNADNIFVNKTKFYNSLAGALNLFVITPAILGLLIPSINEKKTKEAEKAAQAIQQPSFSATPKQIPAQQTESNITITKNAPSLRHLRERTGSTFQKFIG